MKKNISLAIVAMIAAFAMSCSQWIDPAINNDPNNPLDVAPANMLSGVEGSLGWVYGGTLSRMTNLWTQQFFGAGRQHEGFYQYLVTNNDINDNWDNTYQKVMNNAKIMIDKSSSAQLSGYRGLGRIMTALAVGACSDVWGDVPYTDALKGNSGLTPKYDTQQSIYASVQKLLDDGIADLNTVGIAPINNDLIFGGDTKKWIRAAWSIKARYAIHLTKKSGSAAAATQALQFLAKGMTSNADNLLFKYNTDVTKSSPLWQFLDGRQGDLSFGETLQKMMAGLKDPRLGPYSDDTNADYAGFGTFYFSTDSPIMIMSYSESKFIEAEANQRLGNKDVALKAFQDAVSSSLAFIGVPSADAAKYTAQTSVVPLSDITLDRIMEQKYIALFTQPESYNDWRRTGFPKLTPIKGSAIPRRFPLPFEETEYNRANIPAGALNVTTWLYTSVWWDGN